MAVRAACETEVDYDETARLLTEAFAAPGLDFQPQQLRWFYERCFSQGSTVVALREEESGRKVGQLAVVRQTLLHEGRRESAAQLVDLVVAPSHRGKESLRLLYGEVLRQFIAQDIRFAIGMPNAKAMGVNAHFFDLKPFLRLPFTMGLALPRMRSADLVSHGFDRDAPQASRALFGRYRTAPEENGVPWDEDALVARLSGVKHRYGVHAVDEVLLVSSPRRSHSVDYTLLCGFFARPGAHVSPAAVNAVVSAACRMWRRPLFAYAGINSRLPRPPGFAMPDRLRPSPMLVQLRDFKPERGLLRLDRFQLLEFDFG